MHSLPTAFRDWLAALAAAIQFLTRFPLPVHIPFEKKFLQKSVFFFPFAGWLIGIVIFFVAAFLPFVLPLLPSAVIVLIVWVMLSGGLHLDGLMDTADGVLSHRSQERMLEIMKDSRVGAMGALACILSLLLKASLIYELLKASTFYSVYHLYPLLLVPMWSRWMMSLSIIFWPYLRKENGIGELFERTPKRYITCALVYTIGLSYLSVWTIGSGNSYSVAVNSLWMLPVVLFGGLGFGTWIFRKLGGHTGDTYGAMNEVMELLLLVFAVSMQVLINE